MDQRTGKELYPTQWNADFIDMPIVDKDKQKENAPSFTGEQIEKIVNAASGKMQMMVI